MAGPFVRGEAGEVGDKIRDIARRAGVSDSTVSRALADSPLVNPATKERIRRLAEESGYRVNQIARSLSTRASQTLGLVVPELLNPFFPAFVHCLTPYARDRGYSVLLNVSGMEQAEEEVCLRSLYE